MAINSYPIVSEFIKYKQFQSKYKKCHDKGKNIRQVKPLIGHRYRGKAARIQMKLKIRKII
jgi:hypothetical protein